MELKVSRSGEYLEGSVGDGVKYSWAIDEPVKDDEEFLEFLTAVVAWKRETDGEKKMRPFGSKKADDNFAHKGHEGRIKSLESNVGNHEQDIYRLKGVLEGLQDGQRNIRLDHVDLFSRLQERSAEVRDATSKRVEALERRATAAENRLGALESEMLAADARLLRLMRTL